MAKHVFGIPLQFICVTLLIPLCLHWRCEYDVEDVKPCQFSILSLYKQFLLMHSSVPRLYFSETAKHLNSSAFYLSYPVVAIAVQPGGMHITNISYTFGSLIKAPDISESQSFSLHNGLQGAGICETSSLFTSSNKTLLEMECRMCSVTKDRQIYFDHVLVQGQSKYILLGVDRPYEFPGTCIEISWKHRVSGVFPEQNMQCHLRVLSAKESQTVLISLFIFSRCYWYVFPSPFLFYRISCGMYFNRANPFTI